MDPPEVLSPKTVTSFWKKKIPRQMGSVHKRLYENHRKDYNILKRNFDGPFIMKNDIRAAIREMKISKATGLQTISVKLSKAFECNGIQKIATLLNEIYT